MNPSERQVRDRLAALPTFCGRLVDHASRYAGHSCQVARDGTLQIGHMPWVAPMAYAFWLFPAADGRWLDRFESRVGVSIPPDYSGFLRALNGCHAYDLSLYGLAPSMQGDPPRMDRTVVQPLDLGTANTHWASDYLGGPRGFYLGSRAWSYDERVGYFWDDAAIACVRRNGDVVATWPSLPDLLDNELAVAERMMLEKAPQGYW